MKFDYEALTMRALQIITFSGMAKSDAMEAIQDARENKFEEAELKFKSAEKNLVEAEKQHVDLIQYEAQEKKAIGTPLILMHAEDQMLTTQTLILMAQEIVELYKKINKK